MATIRKRGNNWQVQIRVKGHKPVNKSFSDKKIALAWLKKTESEIERGVFQDITEAQQTTFAEILDRYANEVLPSKKGYYRELSRIEHLKTHLGNYSLSGLTPSVISQYRDHRLKTVANQTAKHDLSMISRVINHTIIDWGINLPHGNPIQRVRLPKLPAGRTRRLLPCEEQKLIEASSIDLKPIIQFALETAMRRGEIATMDWNHIDFKSKTLLIPETKTDQPRTIPLTRKAIEILQVFPRNISGKIFNLTVDRISRNFMLACRKAGIADLRFHDLRHEATSRLFEKGLNPMEVAAITGHRDMKMLMRYTHLKAESLVHKLG
ncbi:site-specific integrase [Nitrosococcus wardiae]|uniref:Site-specific integrase n=1 Tax=Nitrosococcus wardiae TaxID=1814290 RepID=A0A4V1AW63_9GAMM|nr:site-specific integrase [Nitrosococcus wardiae]QBQ55535.1 site-specific integrase [Nitrosococcus wardiae]